MLSSLDGISEKFLTRFKKKLETKTKRDGDCLIWMGGLQGRAMRRQGGSVWMMDKTMKRGRRLVGVGRLVWILNKGPIPPKQVISSSCGRRTCIALEHLQCGKPTHRSFRVPPVSMAEFRQIQEAEKGRPWRGGLAALAKELGINPWVARLIHRGATYKHLQ